MTLRTFLVLALVAAGALYGVRYAHDRFLAQNAAYTETKTGSCLRAVPGFRLGETRTTDGSGDDRAVVVFTATNGAIVRFYDSPSDAGYAKTEFDASIQKSGHDSAGMVDVKNNALVGWRAAPSDADRGAVLGCLR